MSNNLNLPPYPFKLRLEGTHSQIFDEVRKKWLVLTPEEWVRQHLIMHLHLNLNYPISLFSIEKGMDINGLKKRVDIIIFNQSGEPVMLIECKSPEIKLGNKTFEQVGVYNQTWRVPYLMISNGMEHYCAHLDLENAQFNFLNEIPEFSSLEIKTKG